MSDSKIRDDSYWRDKLNSKQYEVCRNKGTEPPFTGEYNSEKRAGEYLCACCEAKLFNSDSKYDSGSGWPSFFAASDDACIDEESDESLGMARTEIMCAKCGAHLGHVFPDGPEPTGLRYCVNSLSLQFREQDQE
jgi:peptide-methionine (R)-S-oxide reductase